ncbi:MAG: nucleotidyltransferase domain-containing protein [Ignavibacteriaceae bacterium]
MFPHHRESIRNITEKFKNDPEVLALLISGSIAHGFEDEGSDIDCLIIVPNDVHAKKTEAKALVYNETESCTYEGGYIDGKYITFDFMKTVAGKGSEPARFAFDGVITAFSKINGLQDVINSITTFPVEKKQDNIYRFSCQIEAWKWFTGEALKRKNDYLLQRAVTNLILFGGRMILAHHEVLYPFHKWFLKVLEKNANNPEELMSKINLLLKSPSTDAANDFYSYIKNYTDWEIDTAKSWPNQFLKDSELNWLELSVPVGDI